MPESQRARRRQSQVGSAAAASGAVLGGTGLVAGGIPGAREPKSLKIFTLRGHHRSWAAPKNLLHNARIVGVQPQGGILGFRSNMHEEFIRHNPEKTRGDTYLRGASRGKLKAEHEIVRGMRWGRRATYPLTLGGAALTAAGLRHKRDAEVGKSLEDRQNAAAAALGGGATLGAVGHTVPLVLRRYERRYANSAKDHVRAAQRLAPHFGGLQVEPAKYGAFGEVRRPARETMQPAISDGTLIRGKAHLKIAGGDTAKLRVGEHRATATQHRYFSTVLGRTGRGVRRLRGPGLALAGAGGAGLWTSNAARNRKPRHANVGKRMDDGLHTGVRTAEGLVGVGAFAYGVPRMRSFQRLTERGRPGRRIVTPVERALRQAEAARTVMLHSTDPLARTATRGVAGMPFKVRRALDVVPADLRPATTALAGAILISHSRGRRGEQ